MSNAQQYWKMKKKLLFFLISFIYLCQIYGQVYSELNNTPKDSTEYNFLLPIFGKKVHALGFDLPYSAGISVNYLTQKSNNQYSHCICIYTDNPFEDSKKSVC